jgi:hypothetical protein
MHGLRGLPPLRASTWTQWNVQAEFVQLPCLMQTRAFMASCWWALRGLPPSRPSSLWGRGCQSTRLLDEGRSSPGRHLDRMAIYRLGFQGLPLVGSSCPTSVKAFLPMGPGLSEHQVAEGGTARPASTAGRCSYGRAFWAFCCSSSLSLPLSSSGRLYLHV